MSDDENGGVQLPPGWKASLDKRTGRTFYVNLVTKERTWYRPLRDDEPRDFYRKFDRKTGKIYYVNFATKKTCWKLPPRAVVKDVRDLKLSAAERRKKTPSPAKQAAARLDRSGESQQVFDEADTNGDGVLDQREFAQLIQKARATAVGARPASERKQQQQQQQQQSQQPPPADTAAAREAARHRLPQGEQRVSHGSPSVHISRNGSVHISPARQPQQQQQQDFPQVDNDSEGSFEGGRHAAGAGAGTEPRSTGDFKRRIQEMGAAAQREADDANGGGTPRSRALYPVDSGAERFERPAANDAAESAAYHGATHAKSGVSTLSAHGPDPVLASMHHDTEALDQDNQMLRAQCDDIRSELDGFRSGLHDSLADVAALLETLSGIEDRHQKAAASSPRRLRYGRNPPATPMAIENGPAPAPAAASHSPSRSPAVHISRRGSVTINT